MTAGRTLPVLTPWNQFYWTSGRDGVLRFQRGARSGVIQHPPQPVSASDLDEPLEIVEVTGLGTIVGVTVNRQTWDPQMPAPYVVAVVAIDEDSRVRLTTNIVNATDEQLRVGQRVRVVFEQVDDVWLPMFEPIDGDPVEPPADDGDDVARWHSVRARVSPARYEDSAAITGVGMSRIGRKLGVDPISLTVEAARAAVADAGLELSDIDGLSTYPAGPAEGGFSEGGVTALEAALRLRPTWHNGGGETPGAVGSIQAAALAVHAGLCRHVLVFRTVWQSTYTTLTMSGDIRAGGAARRVGGGGQWSAPFGSQPSSTVAMAMSEYFRRYGATREVLGWIAVNARRNALLNPTAVFRTPLTMDEYLAARMITDPMCLFDCDPLCDGAVAVVVSNVETATDLPNPVVRIDAIGSQITERMEWDQGIRVHEPHVTGPSSHLWTRTGLRPDDVDVAELYDGFSFNCLSWIEALGFCAPGEASDFIDEGRGIALDGRLPLNTHGGQLSHGRTHGMGLVHEAVTQLRHAAGERQVAGAEVAVATSGGLTPGAAMLLRRQG